MSTDPNSVAELLRRARLSGQLNTTNQAPDPNTPQSDTPPSIPLQRQGDPQINAPIPPNARDNALNDYRQMLQTNAPNQADYHPSVGRRIVAGLLGGLAGLHDPKTGYEVGHGIANEKYDKDLTDYQRKLAQKKEAFDTEEEAAKSTASLGEVSARTEKEKEMSEEEKGKLRVLQPGTPESEEKEKQLKIEHPGTLGNQKYDLTLDNGEELKGVTPGPGGTFIDPKTNTPIGPDAIKNVKKVGTESSAVPKPEREGEAGYIDQWKKEHGNREPSAAERLTLHKQYDTAGRKPEDSSARDIVNEFKMQNAREIAQKPHQKNLDLATGQLDRIDRAISMINTSKPEDLALAIPEILTALVSGQGTGVRITTPEMNAMIKARGWGESVEALVNQIKGQGNLSDKQKTDLKGLLQDVQKKVGTRRKDITDLMDKIDSAKSPDDIPKAQIEYRKKLMKRGESEDSKTDDKVIDYVLDPKTKKYIPKTQ